MNTGEARNKKLYISIMIVLAIIVLLATFFVVGRSMAMAEVQLNDGDTLTIEYGSEWNDPGASGKYTFPLLHLLDRHPDVTVSGEIDTRKIGGQTLTYSFDFQGTHGEAIRTVTVVDTTGPEITLTSNPDYYTKPNDEYEEEGYAAFDLHDGDLTESVIREVTDDKIIYTATDSFGNSTTVERKIPYDDRVAPEITLDGGNKIEWTIAIPFEDSFNAIDDVDGDITDKVTVNGKVDTNNIGDYVLTYEVEDAHGNKATAERLVSIVASSEGNGCYVYLTFDDGPYKYTETLLDVLDKYDVKATFFVTAWYGYHEMIGEEFRRGHSVGVHTYYHRYDEIYASEEAFWEDFEKMQELIADQTGERTKIMRFPGGSSNNISSNYNEGIMSRLTKEAEEKGYVYFDWNVSSGDATGIPATSEEITQNIIEGVSGHKNAFVLCHDVKEETVNAIEEAVVYLLQHGYTFLPITENTPPEHHPVNN